MQLMEGCPALCATGECCSVRRVKILLKSCFRGYFVVYLQLQNIGFGIIFVVNTPESDDFKC